MIGNLAEITRCSRLMCIALVNAVIFVLLAASSLPAVTEDYKFREGSLESQSEKDELIEQLKLPGSVSFNFNFVNTDTFKENINGLKEESVGETLTRINGMVEKLKSDGSSYVLHNELAAAYTKIGESERAFRHTLQAVSILESKRLNAASAKEELKLGKDLAGLYLALMASFHGSSEERALLHNKTYVLCDNISKAERSGETAVLMAAFYFLAGDMPKAEIAAEEAYNIDRNNYDTMSLYWIIQYFKLFSGDMGEPAARFSKPVQDYISESPMYKELERHIIRCKDDQLLQGKYEFLRAFIWFSHLTLKAYFFDAESLIAFHKPLPHFTSSDYELLGKTKKNLLELEKHGNIRKEYSLAWRGMLDFINGDLEGSVSSYEKLLFIDPSSETLNILMFLVARTAKNYSKAHALADYKMSRKADAGDYIVKGNIYFLEKKYDHAAASMEKALSKDRGNKKAKLNLAIINLHRKKFNDARSLLNELASDENFEPGDSLNTAIAVHELISGQPVPALDCLKKALKYNRNNEFAKKILNEYYIPEETLP